MKDIRLQLTHWCTLHHGHGKSGYCYEQLDGTHMPAWACNCPYNQGPCPVDWHRAAELVARMDAEEQLAS